MKFLQAAGSASRAFAGGSLGIYAAGYVGGTPSVGIRISFDVFIGATLVGTVDYTPAGNETSRLRASFSALPAGTLRFEWTGRDVYLDAITVQ